MLVLTRRADEAVCLPSLGVRIRVLKLSGGTVRLGIEAPPDVKIVREELAFEVVEDRAERTPSETPLT
jgi:carbon storage regulator